MRFFWLITIGLILLSANWLNAEEPSSPPPPPADVGLPPLIPVESSPPIDGLEPPPPPEEKPLPKIWSGELEFGLAGTEGNSRNFKGRVGSKLKRVTKGHRFTFDALYRYARLNGIPSQDRLFVTDKSEWLLPHSAWNFFLSGTTEYDRFKAFDVRLARHLGIGVDAIKTKLTTLTGRAGAGASREIGGPSNRTVPELLFGADFERKLTERQKLIASFDYFPDATDFGDFRFQGKLTYEFVISPEMGLTLRLGILDLYDSTPQAGRKRNDLDYFATILWQF